MVARTYIILILLILSGCQIQKTPDSIKIGLLAPFESAHRGLGYEALYAARLALADSEYSHIELLAIDDGGSVDSAISRAKAIQHDPAIHSTLVLGVHASAEPVQISFGSHPVIIVGHWNVQPVGEQVLMLANSELTDLQDSDVASELFAIQQSPLLPDEHSPIYIMTSANVPDNQFMERYLQSDSFAPPPGLFATITYDATRIAIESAINGTSIQSTQYTGINGEFQFEDRYWKQAPIRAFGYESGKFIPRPFP